MSEQLQIYAKKLNFEIFENALYMKSVSMPLNEIRFGRNKFCCSEENNSYMSNLCAKQFSESNFD